MPPRVMADADHTGRQTAPMNKRTRALVLRTVQDFSRVYLLVQTAIEGLHDVVRTFTRMILRHRLVSFLYSAV